LPIKTIKIASRIRRRIAAKTTPESTIKQERLEAPRTPVAGVSAEADRAEDGSQADDAAWQVLVVSDEEEEEEDDLISEESGDAGSDPPVNRSLSQYLLLFLLARGCRGVLGVRYLASTLSQDPRLLKLVQVEAASNY